MCVIVWLCSELRSYLGEGSVAEENKGSSSESSACLVDTTTQGMDPTPASQGEWSIRWLANQNPKHTVHNWNHKLVAGLCFGPCAQA